MTIGNRFWSEEEKALECPYCHSKNLYRNGMREKPSKDDLKKYRIFNDRNHICKNCKRRIPHKGLERKIYSDSLKREIFFSYITGQHTKEVNRYSNGWKDRQKRRIPYQQSAYKNKAILPATFFRWKRTLLDTMQTSAFLKNPAIKPIAKKLGKLTFPDLLHRNNIGRNIVPNEDIKTILSIVFCSE